MKIVRQEPTRDVPVPEFLQAPPEGRMVALNDMEMYYETYGQGEPLVLLHGFNGFGGMWRPYVERLAQQHRLIVPDLRGHGRSSNPSGQFTHRQAALDVLALCDHLDLPVIRAVGASTGGMTMLHLATRCQARIESMVLIYATTHFPASARQIMQERNMAMLTDELLAQRRQIHRRGDQQIRALQAQFHGFKDSYDDMNFTPPYLSTITARTLIVHGDRDAFFPVDIPVGMYRAIPRSYLWIVPNWGHGGLELHGREIVETALAFFRGDGWGVSRGATEPPLRG